MIPLRELGRGAFAAVELVSMPIAGKRKLLVCKKLMPQELAQQANTAGQVLQQQQQQPQQQQQQPREEQQQSTQQQQQKQVQQQQYQSAQQQQAPQAEPPLKASSLQDWSREVTMHREAAGCPFVLQLLAAKKCRAGNMLLLTEYAAAGSLTDVLARMRLEQQKAKRAEQEHAFRRCASASAMLQQSHEQQLEGPLAAVRSDEPSVLCTATSDSAAALCDALRDGHTPTAMLIHGVDIDITTFEALAAAAAAGAGNAAAAAAAAAVTGCSDAAAAVGSLGEVSVHHHEPVGLCEESARFYTACILMGLQWLHGRRILHRWAAQHDVCVWIPWLDGAPALRPMHPHLPQLCFVFCSRAVASNSAAANHSQRQMA